MSGSRCLGLLCDRFRSRLLGLLFRSSRPAQRQGLRKMPGETLTQMSAVDRLGKNVVHARFEALVAGVGQRIGRQCQNGQPVETALLLRGADRPGQFEAVHARHVEVG